RKPSTSSRSRATRSTTCRTESYVSTAAGPAGKRGKRTQKGSPTKNGPRKSNSTRDPRKHHIYAACHFGNSGHQAEDRATPPVDGTVRGGRDAAMIRVELAPHLRNLAKVATEVKLEIAGAPTQRSVLDALEASYPVLRGTIRDHVTHRRRDFVRFFAGGQDLS